LIELAPREGEVLLRTEDIEEILSTQGENIALVLFSGVQYYTGQFFDMARITSAGHAKGCIVGFDLAHAVGNVPLYLHEWGCDFACWCTYKYMNCGPGSIGGCFVHEKHGSTNGSISPNSKTHDEEAAEEVEGARGMEESASRGKSVSLVSPGRLAGWWGHRVEDRFVMAPEFVPCEGAYGFRLSNPPVLLMACVRASLDIFDQAGGIEKLREKSILLTGYLEMLLNDELGGHVDIFTPSDPNQRGCQLSLSFHGKCNNQRRIKQ
jgi:kynureninase